MTTSFPHYTQLDAMDCGPTCLKIIAQYFGRNYSLQNLRDKCHITREGVSLLGVSDAAELIGFRSTGVKITWEQFKDEMILPCIVHWNQNHFIVVYKIKKQRGKYFFYVSDPASGLLKYSEEQFRISWVQSFKSTSSLSNDSNEIRLDDPNQPPTLSSQTFNNLNKGKGIALILEPTPEFYKEKGDEDKRLKFSQLLYSLKPYKRYLVQLSIAMLTASVLSLILPFLTQSVVDKGIGTNNLSFVVMILIAQVVLVLGQMKNNLIRYFVSGFCVTH